MDADIKLENDLLDVPDMQTRRRSRLESFDKYLITEEETGSHRPCHVTRLAPSLLHNINKLYENGTITKKQRAQIKAHVLRQSNTSHIVAIENHYRRRSLVLSAETCNPLTTATGTTEETGKNSSLVTVLLALEDSSVASPVHLYDEQDIVLLMGALYKKRRTGMKAGKWDRRYVILTETCLRYYEDKRIFQGKNIGVKWKRKYLPDRGMFVSQTLAGVSPTSLSPTTSSTTSSSSATYTDGHAEECSGGDGSNIFSLVSSDEILTLRASNATEAEKWIMVLSDWLLMNISAREEYRSPSAAAKTTKDDISNTPPFARKHRSTGDSIANPTITMTGVLSKYEGIRGFRSWKPHTFSLQRHVLTYSDVGHSNNVGGYILLNKHYSLSVKSRTKTIILTCRNKAEGGTHTLRADNVQSWNKWVQVLTDTITQIGNAWSRQQHEEEEENSHKEKDDEKKKDENFTKRPTSVPNDDDRNHTSSLSHRSRKSRSMMSENNQMKRGMSMKDVLASQSGRASSTSRTSSISTKITKTTKTSIKDYLSRRVSRTPISDSGRFEHQLLQIQSKRVSQSYRNRNKSNQRNDYQYAARTNTGESIDNKTDGEIALLTKSVKRVVQHAASEESVSGKLFMYIDDIALKKLVESMFIVDVAPNETVYKRGEKGMLLFVVGSGTFEVRGEDGVEGMYKDDDDIKHRKGSNHHQQEQNQTPESTSKTSSQRTEATDIRPDGSNPGDNDLLKFGIGGTLNRNKRSRSVLDRPERPSSVPSNITNDAAVLEGGRQQDEEKSTTNKRESTESNLERWKIHQRARGTSVLRARRSSDTMIRYSLEGDTSGGGDEN